jgi:hypothetical protein
MVAGRGGFELRLVGSGDDGWCRGDRHTKSAADAHNQRDSRMSSTDTRYLSTPLLPGGSDPKTEACGVSRAIRSSARQ